MFVRLLLVLVVIFENVSSERNTKCTTPNGETATCVPALSCQVIVQAFSTGDHAAAEFAQKSQCGYDTEPLVCCGSTGYPTTTTFNFFGLFSSSTPIPSTTPAPIILTDFDVDFLPDRSTCGLIIKEKDRIVGGKVTNFREFPWMAALEYERIGTHENVGIKCGGTIISEKFILTAAHCIRNLEFKLIKVRLGEWNITTDPDCLQQKTANLECADPVQNFTIKKLIPHPFYNRKSAENDIALILLDEEIIFSNYIQPICIPPVNLPAPKIGSNFTVTGWGTTEDGAEHLSDVKLKVELPLYPLDLCKKKLNSVNSANQLCAGGESGKDSCQGDSGGPLMRTYNDSTSANWFLEGIVSYGGQCGRLGFPAIYTKVSSFLTWIINTVSEE